MSHPEVSVPELLHAVEDINAGAQATWRHEGVAELRNVAATTRTNWVYNPEAGPRIEFRETHPGYRSWDEPFTPCLETEIYSSLGVSATLAGGRETTFSIIAYPNLPAIINKDPQDTSVEDLLESIQAKNPDEMVAILGEATKTGAATRMSGGRSVAFHGVGAKQQPHIRAHEVLEDGTLTERYVSINQNRPSDPDHRLFFHTTIQLVGSAAVCEELVYTNTDLKEKFPPVTAEALEMIGGLALSTFEAIRATADARNRDSRQAQSRNRGRPNQGRRGWAKR